MISIETFCDITILDNDKHTLGFLKEYLEENELTLEEFLEDEDAVVDFIQENIDCLDLDFRIIDTSVSLHNLCEGAEE